MRDKIELKIGNRVVRDFISYTVESNIYTADSSFQMQFSYRDSNFSAGQECELWVNNEKELTGIIDRVSKGYDKNGRTYSVEGRDLMGILIDSCCEQFITLSSKTLKQIAETLLIEVPFISRKEIVYGTGAEKKDTAQQFMQIDPGMTIFEALRGAARARGILFYCRADGALVFGVPKGKGRCTLGISVKDGVNRSEIISASSDDDISKRYKKIIVVAQDQGLGNEEPAEINSKAEIEDANFPFYKAYVESVTGDNAVPAHRARMLMEKQKAEGKKIRYRVHGHSQGDKNWTVDEMVAVHDEKLGVYGEYLIYGRRYELNRDEGCTTSIELGEPGLVQ